MPLEKLIERIMKDARELADSIKEEAASRGKQMLGEADREADKVYGSTLEKARKEAEEEKKRKVTNAGLDAQREILAEKQKLIGEVFDRAVERIRGLPREEYLDLLLGMLVEEGQEAEGGQVLLCERDRGSIGAELVERANRALQERGSGTSFELSEETLDIEGGFVIRSGGIEINNSLQWQIKSRREELEPRLVEILFGAVDEE